MTLLGERLAFLVQVQGSNSVSVGNVITLSKKWHKVKCNDLCLTSTRVGVKKNSKFKREWVKVNAVRPMQKNIYSPVCQCSQGLSSNLTTKLPMNLLDFSEQNWKFCSWKCSFHPFQPSQQTFNHDKKLKIVRTFNT